MIRKRIAELDVCDGILQMLHTGKEKTQTKTLAILEMNGKHSFFFNFAFKCGLQSCNKVSNEIGIDIRII